MSEYCANCGAHLPGDAHFCPDCGHTIDDAAVGTGGGTGDQGAAPPSPPATAPPPPSAPYGPTYVQSQPSQPYTAPPPGTEPAGDKSPTAQWIDDNQRLLVWGGAALVVILLLGFITFLALDDGGGSKVASRDDRDGRDRTTTTASTTTTTATRPQVTQPDTDAPLDPAAPPPDDYTPEPAPGEFPGYSYPEDAIGADLAAQGVTNYLGECAALDSMIDYGPDPYCSEYRGAPEPGLGLYFVGPFPGGEFPVWYVLGEVTGGWAVINVIPDDGSGTPPI